MKEQLFEELIKHEMSGCLAYKLLPGDHDNEKVAWVVRPETQYYQAHIELIFFTWVKDGWAAKDYCEAEGPFAVDCPLEYLDMTPPENNYWRKAVKMYWREHKKELKCH